MSLWVTWLSPLWPIQTPMQPGKIWPPCWMMLLSTTIWLVRSGSGGRRRPFGVVGQGGHLRSRRTMDRSDRRSAGRGRLAGQIPRRCCGGGARRRGGQSRTVHRGRTSTDGVEFVTRGGGVRSCHRLVSRDDPSQSGQRRGRRGAAGVAAGHSSGAESRRRAEGSELPAGDHYTGEDCVTPRPVGPGQRGQALRHGRRLAGLGPGRGSDASPPQRRGQRVAQL